MRVEIHQCVIRENGTAVRSYQPQFRIEAVEGKRLKRFGHGKFLGQRPGRLSEGEGMFGPHSRIVRLSHEQRKQSETRKHQTKPTNGAQDEGALFHLEKKDAEDGRLNSVQVIIIR